MLTSQQSPAYFRLPTEANSFQVHNSGSRKEGSSMGGTRTVNTWKAFHGQEFSFVPCFRMQSSHLVDAVEKKPRKMLSAPLFNPIFCLEKILQYTMPA